MIDVEYDVFDYVYPYVKDLVAEDGFKSEYVPAPAELPHATLIEMDNATDTNMMSTADEEEFAVLMYEANAYAYSKADCRQIMGAIDSAMRALGFTRLSMMFISNLNDVSIYRLTARFRAAVSHDRVIFRKK